MNNYRDRTLVYASQMDKQSVRENARSRVLFHDV